MQNLLHLASGLSAKPLELALRRNPQLWNQHSARTTHVKSPHCQVDDIWVRYAATLLEGQGEHESVWYPSLAALPSVRDLAFQVMAMVQGERLGGILITRVPAGHSVLPHIDHGWHAQHYDKFAVQIASHPQQCFRYAEGQHVSAPGDLYWFNNQVEHSVINDSPVERITLILCIRTNQLKG